MPRIILERTLHPALLLPNTFQTPDKHPTVPRNYSPPPKPKPTFDLKKIPPLKLNLFNPTS